MQTYRRNDTMTLIFSNRITGPKSYFFPRYTDIYNVIRKMYNYDKFDIHYMTLYYKELKEVKKILNIDELQNIENKEGISFIYMDMKYNDYNVHIVLDPSDISIHISMDERGYESFVSELKNFI